jgi:3-phytase
MLRLLLAPVLAILLLLTACNDDDNNESFTPQFNQSVTANLETGNLGDPSDADDPAIWVHPTDKSRSLIATSVKDGGLRVYNLQGALVQSIDVGPRVHDAKVKSRFNNVDVAYGFKQVNNTTVDLFVASDRGQDTVKVWRIDPNYTTAPLTDITAAAPARPFPTRPNRDTRPNDSTADLANPVDLQHTIYGMAIWRDAVSGKHFVLGTQRTESRVGQFELIPQADGAVDIKMVRDWRYPYSYRGQSLTEENDDDPRKDWNPQFEGIVADQRNDMAYAGQEDVGIWRINLRSGVADNQPFYSTRGVNTSSFYNPDSRITRDLEGLTVFYGRDGRNYLLTSSQGGAHGDGATLLDPPYDDSFVVFQLRGDQVPELAGSFKIVAGAGIDAVQECDGADVIATALPGFPNGLFITQDGYDNDLNGLDGAVGSSNFKFTAWERIATVLGLATNPNFDPRNP